MGSYMLKEGYEKSPEWGLQWVRRKNLPGGRAMSRVCTRVKEGLLTTAVEGRVSQFFYQSVPGGREE